MQLHGKSYTTFIRAGQYKLDLIPENGSKKIKVTQQVFDFPPTNASYDLRIKGGFKKNVSLILKAIIFQVGLAFYTLYNFTYRTTWCVFPFTLIAMCWSKLLSQCRCSRCGVLCCKKRKTLAKLTKFQSEKSPVHLVSESAPQPVTELLQIRANRLTTNNSFQRESRYVDEFLL